MRAEQAYRNLLRLYPNDYRALFALEMQNAFDRAAQEHRLLSRLVFIRFLQAEFIGLFRGIAGEWIAKLTTDNSIRGRCLPDLRMMRPPGVSRELWFAEAYHNDAQGSLPAEVLEAEAPGARHFSYEERMAHDELRRLRQKYDIAGFGNDGCS